MTRSLTLAAVALSLSGAAVFAEDWPKWLGPRGDGISQEGAIAEQWPVDGPKQLWEKPAGAGYASPVAVDGKVYVFGVMDGSDTLTCYDAESGEQVWSQGYPRSDKADYEGTRATPTIEGSRIYTLGEGGDLTCRELADGSQVWQVNVLSESATQRLMWGCASSPLIVGDLVYVQTGEGGPVAVAVNKETGEVAWKSQAQGKAGYATITHIDVEGTPQLVIFAGTQVLGVDPQAGTTLWEHPWRTKYDVNAATPVYRDGHLFISSEYNHGCAMLKLSAGGAEKLWEKRDVQCKFQPPILDGDHLYANSAGKLVCMSWPDGEILWKGWRDLELGSGGSILRWQDKLLVMSERGALGLVKATPEGAELIGMVELFDEPQVWSTPLLYNGKLYAKSDERFVCLDVAAAVASAGGEAREAAARAE